MTRPGRGKLPERYQAWIDARRRHRLSHAHVQMASELGMNPKKLGKLDNHDQEPWKMPLPDFIEHFYLKSFGRERPEVVLTVEERAARLVAKKEVRGAERKRRRGEAAGLVAAATAPDQQVE